MQRCSLPPDHGLTDGTGHHRLLRVCLSFFGRSAAFRRRRRRRRGELMPMHGEVLRVVSRPARTITQRISCMENITKSPHLLANHGTWEDLHNGKERLHEVNEAVRLVQIRSTVQFSQ